MIKEVHLKKDLNLVLTSRPFHSTILISIEAIKKPDGSYEAYTDNGREKTGKDALEWAKQVVELGAGEIMVTSIDREGTGLGFDLKLIRSIAESVPIPVIACGGAGTIQHIYNAIFTGKADAVSISSILHYNFIKQYNFEDEFSDEGNIEYLKKHKNSFSRIKDTTLPEIKKNMIQSDIMCRDMIDENTDE